MTGASTPKTARWRRRIIGPFTLGHIVTVGGVLLVAALGLGLLTSPIATPATPSLPAPGEDFFRTGEATTGLALGQVAPELRGAVDGTDAPLLDLAGEEVTLAERRGSPVWLTFFATWCPPCQEETPVLREAHARYAPQGLEMVAVSVQETTADDVAAYADTYALPYTIGFDATSAVYRTYQGFGLPTHYFLDGDGVIRNVYFGPLTRSQVASIVEPLLALDEDRTATSG